MPTRWLLGTEWAKANTRVAAPFSTWGQWAEGAGLNGNVLIIGNQSVSNLKVEEAIGWYEANGTTTWGYLTVRKYDLYTATGLSLGRFSYGGAFGVGFSA